MLSEIPALLKKPERLRVAQETVASWATLSKVLPTIQAKSILVVFLAAELSGKRRPFILSRIYSRLETVRRNEEMAMLKRHIPGGVRETRNGLYFDKTWHA